MLSAQNSAIDLNWIHTSEMIISGTFMLTNVLPGHQNSVVNLKTRVSPALEQCSTHIFYSVNIC